MTLVRVSTTIAAALGLALLAACSSSTPGQQLAADAAKALGGAEAVSAVNSLVLEGEGKQYRLGQDVRPDARTQSYTVSAYKQALDFASGRARTEVTRTATFPSGQGSAPQTTSQGFDGTVAWNVGANGTATRQAATVVGERRAELYHHPVAAVRAALDPAATVGSPRTAGNETLLDVVAPGGQKLTLVVNSLTKLPTRVVTASYHPNLGDVAISTSFEDYRAVGALKLPARITSRIDDFTAAEFDLKAHGVNAATGEIAAPAEVASAPADPPVNVTVDQLGKGVWRLAGGTHHSVLVEFKDHGVLIEAPQSEARALAVIAKSRELLGAKPLTKVVTSHHHYDHTGGLRAAMAEGLEILTHNGNVSSFERMAERPHTLSPDQLAKAPKEPKVESIGTGLLLSDDTNTLQLLPITTPHSETMLVAWLPRDALLVEADVYTPGGAAMPFAAKLRQEITALKLEPGRIVPLHGDVVPFARFARDAAAAAAGPG